MPLGFSKLQRTYLYLKSIFLTQVQKIAFVLLNMQPNTFYKMVWENFLISILKLNWWKVRIIWRQFENAPNVKTREPEGLKKEIGVSMTLKEAVITVSYFIWATNFQVLLCVPRACFHSDWHCISSGTSFALSSSSAWGFSRTLW